LDLDEDALVRTPLLCPICQYPAEVLNDSHPGYQQPSSFVIAECSYCDTQFCNPMTSCAELYGRIYEHAATLPGYSRYKWYAERITHKANPLRWLAAREEAYAFIAYELRNAKNSRVLEIGCGLGYLTFALARAGYDARGIELSERAVTAARARFGNLFDVCDVSQARGASFLVDVVVMTEVLEHTADPITLLHSINGMLRPGGFALITTPNKSSARRAAYWMTDNPPVHLWWFSETALRRLAQMTGFVISFHPSEPRSTTPLWPPFLNEKGRQIFPSSAFRRILQMFPGLAFSGIAVARNRRQRRAMRQASNERAATMCVILHKPAS
jgi:2-polyprenyl-3-methyl-5-hydroxy-6-metoxy-1,4-benzoquinol methylase